MGSTVGATVGAGETVGPRITGDVISIADTFGLLGPLSIKITSRNPSSTSAAKSNVKALLLSPPPSSTRSMLERVVPSTSMSKTRFPCASKYYGIEDEV